MTHLRRVIVLATLLATAGCMELQRALNPQSGGAEEERGYGPVATNEGDDEGIPELPEDLEEVVTESGLRYIDIEEGTGAVPEDGDEIEAHYTGWLEDGTEFDRSLDRDQPVTFVLGAGEVIDGWDEGVAGMREGGRRRLIIPPELAYGEAGRPPSIPPNATLIFDVELIAVHLADGEGDGDDAEGETSDAEQDDGADEEEDEEGIPELPEDLEEVVTESGLRYIDIEEGTGAVPEDGDEIEAHYTGWLEDGTEADSSLDSDQPFVFVLGAGVVIDGWEEGVATMRVGGRRRFIIPPELAYGEAGRPPVIPPNATVIFDIELIAVHSADG